MGLKVEAVSQYAANEFGSPLAAETPVSPALSLAATRLAGGALPFEFLPPRVTVWQQAARKYSSGRLRFAGAASAAVLLIVGGLFLFQQWQLARLQLHWNGMATKVRELEQIQQQIRQFRPWYDENIRGLTMLRLLTQAFPEDGVVSAKTVELRDLNTVTCSGLARDYQALLKTLERLRATPGVSDVRLSTIRGKAPMQFTFDFRWNEGGRHEN